MRVDRVDARNMSREELIELIREGKAEGAILRGVDLSGAYLTAANFRNADLREADLMGADLRGADFDSAKMGRVDLSGADLRDASFVDSDLQYANLAFARCRNTDFKRVDLSHAHLTEADLRGAYFTGVNLLTGATFFDVNLFGTMGLRAVSVALTVPNARSSKLVGIVIDDEIRVFHERRSGRPDHFREVYHRDSPYDVAFRRALDFVESSLEGYLRAY